MPLTPPPVPFREDLQTTVRKLVYYFGLQSGVLHLPRRGRCDMDACIALFTAIDPEVRCVQVYAGRTIVNTYTRLDTASAWKAY